MKYEISLSFEIGYGDNKVSSFFTVEDEDKEKGWTKLEEMTDKKLENTTN